MVDNFMKTIINKETSTEVTLKVIRRNLIIHFEGATSKLDFKQVFTISYFYHKGTKKWFHKETYNKLMSVYLKIMDYIGSLESEYDSITVEGFSQGGALAEQDFLMLRDVLHVKNVSCLILDPYKGVLAFPELIHVCSKSVVRFWPIFLPKAKKMRKHKSPYHWWNFVKNHFHIREVLCFAN